MFSSDTTWRTELQEQKYKVKPARSVFDSIHLLVCGELELIVSMILEKSKESIYIHCI